MPRFCGRMLRATCVRSGAPACPRRSAGRNGGFGGSFRENRFACVCLGGLYGIVVYLFPVPRAKKGVYLLKLLSLLFQKECTFFISYSISILAWRFSGTFAELLRGIYSAPLQVVIN